MSKVFSNVNLGDPENVIIESVRPWELMKDPATICSWFEGKQIIRALFDGADLVLLLRDTERQPYSMSQYYLAKCCSNDINEFGRIQIHRLEMDHVSAQTFINYVDRMKEERQVYSKDPGPYTENHSYE